MTEEKTTQENKLLSPIYNNSNNKAGYNQHTSPNLPKPIPLSKRINTNEKPSEKRLYNRKHFKSVKRFKQTHRPKQSRTSKAIHSITRHVNELQKKPMHSIQQVLPILPNKMGNATL